MSGVDDDVFHELIHQFELRERLHHGLDVPGGKLVGRHDHCGQHPGIGIAGGPKLERKRVIDFQLFGQAP